MDPLFASPSLLALSAPVLAQSGGYSFLQAILAYFVDPILTLLYIAVIVYVISSWLISFNVINPHNQLVSTILRMLSAVIDPLMRPFRAIIPPLGGLDLSPIFLLLSIVFVQQYLVRQVLFPLVG